MRKSELQNYIKLNWGKKDILRILDDLNIDLYSLLQIALDLNLQSMETGDITRRWTNGEDKFLKDHSHLLSIQEACNLLHRSRYATYQRVKLLNLEEMVGKRNMKR